MPRKVSDLLKKLDEMRETASIISELPGGLGELDEPRIYLSVEQAHVCKELPGLEGLELPGWVRQSLVADARGFSHDGIERALDSMVGRAWVWATEFENVHEMWWFAEPRIKIGGVTYDESLLERFFSRVGLVKLTCAGTFWTTP